MGTDTMIFIRKKSLLILDFFDLTRLYNEFGRWHYFMERFNLEFDVRKISIDELVRHLASTEKVKQKDRDFISSMSKYDIIFQADTIESEPEGYISIWSITRKCEEAIKELTDNTEKQKVKDE